MLSEGDIVCEWGSASRALAGETTSGDMCLIEPFAGGTLTAVADGLGHGEEAAAAARRAIATVRKRAGEPVLKLIEICHERLRGSRGVVLSLASIDAATSTMTWAGVGNVEARLFHEDEESTVSREALMLRSGVVGYRIPSLRASSLALEPGDLITFVTDGISGGFENDVDIRQPPQHVAETILQEKGKISDDALVLVVRFLGADKNAAGKRL